MEDLSYILEQADRCLNCKNPMCRNGCPVSTHIPEFIDKIKNKEFEEAFYILLENNIMSKICSTVCPVEEQCMGSCVRGIKGEPVQINILEKFVNDWAEEHKIKYKPVLQNISNKKVAIIGSGPSGIACALELRKAGCDVTIFEKEEKFGGILEYGIPDFRLNKDIIHNLINELKSLGIKFVNNKELENNLTIQELKASGFDSIFIGIGVQKQSTYWLTDSLTNSIYKSDEFLKQYSEGKKIKNLGTTVIIGGGNVAFDSARAAIRMGAKEVYIIYRRNKDLMPARKIELEDALKDGVKIIWQTKVISAQVEDKKIKTIECIKTRIEDNKAVDIENTNYTMKADSIVYAIGAKADEKFFEKIGIKTENGLICVNENNMTNIDEVYAGGDLIESRTSVCRAIATGKKAAKAIIEGKGSDT